MSEVDGKLKRQIARKARNKRDGNFSETFYNTYDMTNVVFSLGDTTIGGRFNGFVEDNQGLLEVDGAIEFYLKDEFADPADIGEIRKRLGNEDAQDVDIVDPTRRSEMIYENVHRPLDNYIRGRWVCLKLDLKSSASSQALHTISPINGQAPFKVTFF